MMPVDEVGAAARHATACVLLAIEAVFALVLVAPLLTAEVGFGFDLGLYTAPFLPGLPLLAVIIARSTPRGRLVSTVALAEYAAVAALPAIGIYFRLTSMADHPFEGELIAGLQLLVLLALLALVLVAGYWTAAIRRGLRGAAVMPDGPSEEQANEFDFVASAPLDVTPD